MTNLIPDDDARRAMRQFKAGRKRRRFVQAAQGAAAHHDAVVRVRRLQTVLDLLVTFARCKDAASVPGQP